MTIKERDANHIWWRGRTKEAGFANVEALQTAFDVKPYRLRQIYHAATKELVSGFDQITVLPMSLRKTLAQKLRLSSGKVTAEATSGDKQTTKVVLEFADGKDV